MGYTKEYGVGVSPRILEALQYFVHEEKENGGWEKAQNQYRPHNACARPETETEADVTGMTVDDLVGPVAIALLFCVIGQVYFLATWLRHKMMPPSFHATRSDLWSPRSKRVMSPESIDAIIEGLVRELKPCMRSK